MSAIRTQLEESVVIEKWWRHLTELEACVMVARVCEHLEMSPTRFREAIESPWKWKVEAWRFAHGMEVE